MIRLVGIRYWKYIILVCHLTGEFWHQNQGEI